LVLGDGGEVIVVQQCTALCRVALTQVERTALPDHVGGHEQPDRAVDRPAAPGDLGIGVLGLYFVAEEPRRLAGGVGDQRLGFRQLQPELLTQERLDLRLDLFGFVPGTGEPQQPVVGIPHGAKPPIVRIVGVLARQPAALLAKRSQRLAVAGTVNTTV